MGVEALGVVKPGPEGREEFNISRCRRSKIGGGISLSSRASSTSPWNGNVSQQVPYAGLLECSLFLLVVVSSASERTETLADGTSAREAGGGGGGDISIGIDCYST